MTYPKTQQERVAREREETRKKNAEELNYLCKKWGLTLLETDYNAAPRKTVQIVKCGNCSKKYTTSLYNLRKKSRHICQACRHTLRYTSNTTGTTANVKTNQNTTAQNQNKTTQNGYPFSLNVQTKKITNKAGMIKYLKSVNSTYSNFIISFYTSKKARHTSRSGQEGYEIHHIIPQSQGGPNSSWNQIMLSVKDHVLAHLYLAGDFENPSDLISLRNMGLS